MNCRPRLSAVRPEGQRLLARGVRLVEDRLAAGQRGRARVAEAADAAQGAEVVVEGAVLLHQDDDVLDVLERPGPGGGRDRGGSGDAAGEHGRGGGGAGELQEPSAIDVGHEWLLLTSGGAARQRTCLRAVRPEGSL